MNSDKNEIHTLVNQLRLQIPILELLLHKYSAKLTTIQQQKYEKAKSFYEIIQNEQKLRSCPKKTLEHYLEVIKKISVNLGTGPSSADADDTSYKCRPLKLESGVFDKEEDIFQRRPKIQTSSPTIIETINIISDDDDEVNRCNNSNNNVNDNDNDNNNSINTESGCIVIDDSDDSDTAAKQKENKLNKAKSKLNMIMGKHCDNSSRVSESASSKEPNNKQVLTAQEKSVCDLAKRITYTPNQPLVNSNTVFNNQNTGNSVLNTPSSGRSSQPIGAAKYSSIKNIKVKKRNLVNDDYIDQTSLIDNPTTPSVKSPEQQQMDLIAGTESQTQTPTYAQSKKYDYDTDATADIIPSEESSSESDDSLPKRNTRNRGRSPFRKNQNTSESAKNNKRSASTGRGGSPRPQSRERPRSQSRGRPRTQSRDEGLGKHSQKRPAPVHSRRKTLVPNSNIDPPKRSRSRGRPPSRAGSRPRGRPPSRAGSRPRGRPPSRARKASNSDDNEIDQRIGPSTNNISPVKNQSVPVRINQRRRSVPATYVVDKSTDDSDDNDFVSTTTSTSNSNFDEKKRDFDFEKGLDSRLPRNVNKEMFASNPIYARKCFLCSKQVKLLVNHYVKDHPKSEIYISRFSVETARTLKSAKVKKALINAQNLEAFCHFCEKIITYREHYWPQHILSHTGEYQHYCTVCKILCNYHNYHKTCGGKVDLVFKYKWIDQTLFAFICNLCNYVQVRERNMIYHLIHQHETPKDECCNKYQKITLIRYTSNESEISDETVPVTVKTENNYYEETNSIPITYIGPNTSTNNTSQTVCSSNNNETSNPDPNLNNHVEDDIPIIFVGPSGESAVTSEVSFHNNRETEEPMDQSDQNEATVGEPVIVKEEMDVNNDNVNIGGENTAAVPSTERNVLISNPSNTNYVLPKITSVESIRDKAPMDRLKLTNTIIHNNLAGTTNNKEAITTDTSKGNPRIKYTPTRTNTSNGAAQLETISVAERIRPEIYQNISIKSENNDDTELRLDDSQIQAFLDLYETHKKTAANNSKSGQLKINVKPWSIEPYFIRNDSKKLSDVVLYGRYKCMATYCVFATNDETKMRKHLENHVTYMKFLEKTYNISPQKDMLWTKCAYCDMTCEPNSTDLINHINQEHGTSMFQCSCCYYRTIELDNIVTHMSEFHKENAKLVLLCEAEKPNLLTEKLKMQQSRKSNMPEYPCGIDCSKKDFLLGEHLVYHLINSAGHKDLFNFRCPICKVLLAKSKSHLHFMLHDRNEFHCLYCKVGLKHVEKMRGHIAKRHPSKLLYASARRLRKDKSIEQINPHDPDSLIIVNLSPVTDISDFKFIRSPFDTQQLNFMKEELAAFKYNSMEVAPICLPDALADEEVMELVNDFSLSTSSDLFVMYEDYCTKYQNPIPSEQIELWEKVNGNFEPNNETNLNDNSANTEKSNDVIDEMGKQLEMNLIKTEPTELSVPSSQVGHLNQSNNSACSKESSDIINPSSHTFMYYCNYCSIKLRSLSHLHNHWKAMHKQQITANQPHPFQFKIEKIYTCFYCNKSASYLSIRNHISTLHSGEKFATLSTNNCNQCGQCSFIVETEDEFITHYENSHIAIEGAETQARYGFLTDNFLQDILNTRFGRKFKCALCTNVYFDNEEMLKAHFTTQHPQKIVQFIETDDDRITFKASCCRYSSNDEFETIKHIWRHTKKFKCNFCDTMLDNFTTLQTHHRMIHQSTDSMYKDEEIDTVLHRYLNMQLIFGNGLVLTKQALEKTKHGSIKGYIDTITELDANKRQLYERCLNSKVTNPVGTESNVSNSQGSGDLQVSARMRRKNRSRQIESSSDSSDDINRSLLWSTRPSHKRRRLMSSTSSNASTVPQSIPSAHVQDVSITLNRDVVYEDNEK